ncbi:MAG: CDP-2,3-bis-(O-geranylgeranyl)-sn-glycerol synthase [Thermoplasmata archaeon]|nr:CDP-2,3-bis-(O-geranylgeranyl)-sn-glycerol synthase [Thermoplasmata archaeon]
MTQGAEPPPVLASSVASLDPSALSNCYNAVADSWAMDYVNEAVVGLYLFLPAFLANSAAVLTGCGTPVDLGATLGGRRLLGAGKTWAGLVGGTLSGGFIGLLLMLAAVAVGTPTYGSGMGAIAIPFLLAFGSLFGDMLGSFVKRRLGIERGAKAPGLDQYDFVVGTFIVGLAVIPGFTIGTYIAGPAIAALVAIVVLTPILHRGMNLLGYKMGKKQVPW